MKTKKKKEVLNGSHYERDCEFVVGGKDDDKDRLDEGGEGSSGKVGGDEMGGDEMGGDEMGGDEMGGDEMGGDDGDDKKISNEEDNVGKEGGCVNEDEGQDNGGGKVEDVESGGKNGNFCGRNKNGDGDENVAECGSDKKIAKGCGVDGEGKGCAGGVEGKGRKEVTEKEPEKSKNIEYVPILN